MSNKVNIFSINVKKKNIGTHVFESCLQKQEEIKKFFSSCTSQESKYAKIIELGRKGQKLAPEYITPKNLVKGCQSQVYLYTYWENGKIWFQAGADALISAGLAALLVNVYNGEDLETILKCAPSYLEELGIGSSLTPNRANGLYSIHLRMKQDAIQVYTQQKVEQS
jgi:cysteine desulfuration protein SufE